MNLGIEDKVALVTGASRSIGMAIAAALASEGARVVLVARDNAKLADVQSKLPGGAQRHHALALDLSLQENTQKLAQTLIEQFGAPDIVVHNLGGSLGIRDAFAPSGQWRDVWHLNVGIVVELNRLLVPAMIKKKWGRIVHLSTLATTTYQGNAAYVSAKAALNAYVKVVGREVAKHNIVMSAIAPGAICVEGRYFAKVMKENPAELEEYYKQHLPAWRLGTTEEVGAATAFLCSEQAAFMSGSIVGIDGGGM